MITLSQKEVHPEWLLKRFKNEMRADFSKGGNQFDTKCRDAFRRFAMMLVLWQVDQGFIKGLIWQPDLSAEDYLDFKNAVSKQTEGK